MARGGTTVYAVLLAFAGSLAQVAASDEVMRHVSQCNYCMKCHLGDAPPAGYVAYVSTDSVAANSSASATSNSGSSSSAAHRRLHGADARALPRLQPTLELRSSGELLRQLAAAWQAYRSGGRALAATASDEDADATDSTSAGRSLTKRSKRSKRKRSKKPRGLDDGLAPDTPPELRPSSYLATAKDVVPKQMLPNCTQCYGCNTELTLLASNTTFLDRIYINERGATTSWIFKATTNRTASGFAVVKVYCLPVPKRPGAKVPICSPNTLLRIMTHLRALDKLVEDCGFTDLVPRVWLAPVNAIVPDVGYHVRWYSLWMEYVEGISLENFLNKGLPKRQDLPVMLDLLSAKLNKSKVVRAAVFDLLTSQCDRHAQNIFIQADGNIRLIDNEACLQNTWKNCGFDSILVPTTQKQEIIRLSNQFVLKLVGPDGAPKDRADLQLLLDYRCYLGEGREALGTDYPPEVTACLSHVAGMSPQQVMDRYGFPELSVAENLHTRATDMLERGYEWAAKYGEPQNAPPKKYRFQPKCCQLQLVTRANLFQCAHEWQPKFELPRGNPTTGREWNKDKPDTGTYDGGDFGDSGEGPGADAVAAGGGASVVVSTETLAVE